MSKTFITLSDFAKLYGIPNKILAPPIFYNPKHHSKDTYSVIKSFRLSTNLSPTQTLVISPNDVLLIPSNFVATFDRNVLIDSIPFAPNPLYSSKTTYPNPNIGIIDNSGTINITDSATLETNSNSMISNSLNGKILCVGATIRFNNYSVLKNEGHINFNSSTFSFLGWLMYNGTKISKISGNGINLLLTEPVQTLPPTSTTSKILYQPSAIMSSIVTVTSITTVNTINLVIEVSDSKETGFAKGGQYGGPMHIYTNNSPGPYICKLPVIPGGKIQSGTFTIVKYTIQQIARPQSVGLSTNPLKTLGGAGTDMLELATIPQADVSSASEGSVNPFNIRVQALSLDTQYYLYIYDGLGNDAGGQYISYKITMVLLKEPVQTLPPTSTTSKILYQPSDIMSSIVNVTSITTVNTINLVIEVSDSKETGFAKGGQYGGPMHIYTNNSPGPYICKLPVIPGGKIQSGTFTIVKYTIQQIARPQSVGLSTNPLKTLGGAGTDMLELATIPQADVSSASEGSVNPFNIRVQALSLDTQYYLYIYDGLGNDAGGQQISYKITMVINK